MTGKKRRTVLWWILGVILFCALCLLLWRFGPEHKDFITSLIALGGVVAVVIGIFQTQRRITKQEEQFNKQQRDVRYASGVELLGNPHESTRIGGAYNLYSLARDYEEYRTPVCEILCAHIRTITGDKDYQKKYQDGASNKIRAYLEMGNKDQEWHEDRPSNEVQTIIDLLFIKPDGVSMFNDKEKDLRDAFLWKVHFGHAKLNNVMFCRANLSYAMFWDAEVDNVNFILATLRGTDFQDAKLTYRMDFKYALVENVNFAGTFLENMSVEEITRKGHELDFMKELKRDQ